MTKVVILTIAIILTLINFCESKEITTKLNSSISENILRGTISSATSLIFPGLNALVEYDKVTRTVYVKFTQSKYSKIDYSDFWLPWRDNQWVVLQEFKTSSIDTEFVIVESNLRDGSGDVRIVTASPDVDRFGKNPNDNLWIKSSSFYLRKKNSVTWEKIAD